MQYQTPNRKRRVAFNIDEASYAKLEALYPFRTTPDSQGHRRIDWRTAIGLLIKQREQQGQVTL